MSPHELRDESETLGISMDLDINDTIGIPLRYAHDLRAFDPLSQRHGERRRSWRIWTRILDQVHSGPFRMAGDQELDGTARTVATQDEIGRAGLYDMLNTCTCDDRGEFVNDSP